MSRYVMMFALIILLVPWTVSANPEKTFILPGDAEIEMVWIEPGTFTMGTTEAQEETLRSKRMWESSFENEQPAHQVTITRGFYMGKVEVTQEQWENVMGTTPWSGKQYVQEAPDNVAAYISWNDMQEFIHRLNAVEGSEVYRLPTEGEWEYACRAGPTTLWSFGDDKSQLRDYAWFYDNAWSAGDQYGHEVGTKLPNLWGLYDMHGNVWEWVQDWYDANYYSMSPSVDPTGPSTGLNRVLRGGIFIDFARLTRSVIT